MWDSVEDTWKDKHNGATKNKNEAHAWTDCQKKMDFYEFISEYWVKLLYITLWLITNTLKNKNTSNYSPCGIKVYIFTTLSGLHTFFLNA